jgi:hypothetical protein
MLGRVKLLFPYQKLILPVQQRSLVMSNNCFAPPASLFDQISFEKHKLKNHFDELIVYFKKNFSINSSSLFTEWLLHSSTFKKRRTKMNNHKLRKRRKKLRMNTKISRS